MSEFPFVYPVGMQNMKRLLERPIPTFEALWLWWSTEAKRARKTRRTPRHVRIR
jgi:hypothetical protein